MIFELRIYTIKKGCRNKWIELMERVIIPFQVEMGMTVIGSFISLDHEDEYIWIRRFNDEDHRKELYDAVYGSTYWKTKIKKLIGDMLIRKKVSVHLLKATPGSEIQ
jgi:hypothetical protein